MNKRGIGAIVAMVLIILLVVGSIVIIWAVVRPIVEKTGEGAGEGQFSVVLQIEDFKVESDGNISLTVSRGASGPDLPSLRVIIFDGTDTTTFTTQGLDKMQTKKLTLPSGGLVKKISVAPVFESSSGDEQIGNVGAKLEFSNKEVMKNHGAVAWWRLEGDAEDEINGYDGSCTICPTLVVGKFGEGYDFIRDNKEHFSIPDNLIDISEGISVSLWIKPESDGGSILRVFATIDLDDDKFTIATLRKSSNIYELQTRVNSQSTKTNDQNSELYGNIFNHIIVTVDSNFIRKTYINGIEYSFIDGDFTGESSLSAIGAGREHLDYSFEGIIDEPMIFDRALTAEEVKSLYNLDLS